MLAALEPLAQEVDFSLVWEAVEVVLAGDLALLHARGSGVLRTAAGTRTMPYRCTGVLARAAGGWRWRVYHGSEPAASG